MRVGNELSKTLALATGGFVTIEGLALAALGVIDGSGDLSLLQFTAITLGVAVLVLSALLVFNTWKLEHLSGNAKILEGTEKLYDYLYRRKDSVVKSAKKTLIVTGSRSRDQGYLDAILEKAQVSDLTLLRVLYERPSKISRELQTHLDQLVSFANTIPRKDGPRRISIVSLPRESDEPERFICASESQAVVIIQSPNRLDGYDAAVLIRDRKFCERLVQQLSNSRLLKGASEIQTLDQIASLVRSQ